MNNTNNTVNSNDVDIMKNNFNDQNVQLLENPSPLTSNKSDDSMFSFTLTEKVVYFIIFALLILFIVVYFLNYEETMETLNNFSNYLYNVFILPIRNFFSNDSKKTKTKDDNSKTKDVVPVNDVNDVNDVSNKSKKYIINDKLKVDVNKKKKKYTHIYSDQSDSSIQTSTKWCYIGNENGSRKCAPITNNTCMSQNIYPSLKQCETLK
jgi:hypothetical protein